MDMKTTMSSSTRFLTILNPVFLFKHSLPGEVKSVPLSVRYASVQWSLFCEVVLIPTLIPQPGKRGIGIVLML
jgi:hypothetical protein